VTRTDPSPMPYDRPLPGPVLASAPARRRDSVRRTSTVDVTRRAGGSPFDQFERVEGATRDLVTDGTGAATVVERARLVVALEDGVIVRVEPERPTSVCEGLLGCRIGFSFRSAAKEVLVALAGTGLGLLVDDLSGAIAPSGYAGMRHGALATGSLPAPMPAAPETGDDAPTHRSQLDVCAGWRAGGAATGRRERGEPLPLAEPWAAPSLADGDALAWHEMPPLTPLQTRRLRRIDLWREGEQLAVDLMFRDVMVDPDGTERVVHEYAVAGEIHEPTMTVAWLTADPRALPFPTDCPIAAGSAAFIVGHAVGDLRRSVRQISVGPASCTHLNDLYRSIADVTTLARHLPEPA
jgi:hypothetical protein